MSNAKLSKEEKQLIDAVKAGEFESVLTKNAKPNWLLRQKILCAKISE